MEQRLRLGQLLVDASIISEEQLQEVLKLQKADGRKLGTLLVERGLINETQLTQILSQQLSVPWVSLYHVDFSRRLLSLVPRDVCEKFCLVPIYVRHVRGQGETLYVAMDDPTNEEALKNCSMWSGLPTRAMISSPSDIRNAIRVYYPDTRRASVPPPAAEPEPVRKQPAADIPAPPPEIAGPPATAEQPAAEKVEAAPEQAAEAAREEVAEPSAPEEPKAEPSIPPPEEVASAWKPPASASTQQLVESPDVFKMDFDHPPPAAPAPASDQGAAQAPSELAATAEQPAAELAATVEHAAVEVAEKVEQPAATAEQAAETMEHPAAEPAAVAPPEGERPAEPAEARPQVLDTGTLQAGAPAEPEPSPAEGSASDEVTLEVGKEIPLEEVLSEVRRARPAPTGGAARLMALTMLDGTTLALPVRRRKALRREGAEGEPQAGERPPSEAPPPPSSRPAHRRTDLPANLTAAEVVAALRASAQGEDVSEILGSHADWQSMFAALLSLLIRKKLISGDDFVEQLRRL